jgi:hypothetical protein
MLGHQGVETAVAALLLRRSIADSIEHRPRSRLNGVSVFQLCTASLAYRKLRMDLHHLKQRSTVHTGQHSRYPGVDCLHPVQMAW